jgi:hypothetical protein
MFQWERRGLEEEEEEEEESILMNRPINILVLVEKIHFKHPAY